MKLPIHERLLDDGTLEQRILSADLPDALGVDPQHPADWRDVGQTMRSLGWEGPAGLRIDGKFVRGYRRKLAPVRAEVS